MLAYDDNDRELNRCVVEDWIGNNSETFFADIQPVLRPVPSRKCAPLYSAWE